MLMGPFLTRRRRLMLGQPLSNPPCQTVGMRIKKQCKIPPTPDETIGQFGQVRLVRKWGDVHVLAGGSERERRLVRAWCAIYATFLVFVEPSADEIALAA